MRSADDRRFPGAEALAGGCLAALLALSCLACATTRTRREWYRASIVACERGGDLDGVYFFTVRWDDGRGVHQQRRVAATKREYILFVRDVHELCVLETTNGMKMEPCRG
jgi:hypothetical protein